MLPAYLSPLLAVQEAAPTVNGQKPILGKEEGVVFSQPFPLSFNIGKVIGVIAGYLLPVVAKVAFLTVFSLQFQI